MMLLNRKFKGRIIGGYDIDGQLGSGSASRVFGSGNLAIKVFHADPINYEDYASELHILHLLSRNKNHNVAQAVNYGAHVEMISGWPKIHPFVLYERFETSLTKYMRRNPGGFYNDTAVSITHQILNGLQYIHSFDILHGDIKPSNIFIKKVDNGWHAVIGDFSASSVIGELNNFCIGSVPHLSPEIIVEYRKLYSLGTDIWSLVSTIFYIFAGEAFFDIYNQREYDYGKLVVKNYLHENIADDTQEMLVDDTNEIDEQDIIEDTSSSDDNEVVLNDVEESLEEKQELSMILAIAYVMLGPPPQTYEQSNKFANFYAKNKMSVLGYPPGIAKSKPISAIVLDRATAPNNNFAKHLIIDPAKFKLYVNKMAEIMVGGIKYMPDKRIQISEIAKKITELTQIQ